LTKRAKVVIRWLLDLATVKKMIEFDKKGKSSYMQKYIIRCSIGLLIFIPFIKD